MYKVVRCANVEYGLVNGSTYFRTTRYWFNPNSKKIYDPIFFKTNYLAYYASLLLTQCVYPPPTHIKQNKGNKQQRCMYVSIILKCLEGIYFRVESRVACSCGFNQKPIP